MTVRFGSPSAAAQVRAAVVSVNGDTNQQRSNRTQQHNNQQGRQNSYASQFINNGTGFFSMGGMNHHC